jgi:hypothetical protein
MSPKLFACFLGWIGGLRIALVTTSTSGALFSSYAISRRIFAAFPYKGTHLRTTALGRSVVGIELLFTPLARTRKARPFLWAAMFVVQLGFLCLLNFAGESQRSVASSLRTMLAIMYESPST